MTTTMTSTEDQRERARDLAQQHLTDLLTGDRSPYDGLDRRTGDWQILADLVRTSQEFQQFAQRITNDLASAVEFASGRSGRMNSLGVLQGDATRVDGLAMLFHARIDYAKDALFDHYLAQIRETDAEWETVEAFGPRAAECAEKARTTAKVTGSVGATYCIGTESDPLAAPTSSATVRRTQ